MSIEGQDTFLSAARGIVHVGASTGQERDIYDRYDLPVVWIEAIPDVFELLRQNLKAFPKQVALQGLLTDKDGAEYTFHISNNEGMSSSVLDLGMHRDIWPEVDYIRSIRLESKTLPRLLSHAGIDLAEYDTLVMDTQGSELLILQGASPILQNFRFVKTEAPDFESYRGCCLVGDLEKFLAEYGFRERERYRFAEHPSGGSYYDIIFERPVSDASQATR